MRFPPIPLVAEVITRADNGARTAVAGVSAVEKGATKLIPIPLVADAVTFIDGGARTAVSTVVGEKESVKVTPIPLVSGAINLVDNDARTTAAGLSAMVGEKEAPPRLIDSVGESWKDRAKGNAITSNIPILTRIGGGLIDSAGRLKDQTENDVVTSNIPILNNTNDGEGVSDRSKQDGWSSLGDYVPGIGHVAGIVNLVTGNPDGHRCRLGAKCIVVAKCMIGAISTAVMSCATEAIKAYATAYATAAVKAGATSALTAGASLATGGVGLFGGAVAKGAGTALGGVTTGIKTATFGKVPSLGATKAASRLMSFSL
ncbi:hypothetical protein FHETE_10975 [Fusarium heterosporum]|uniref:Uncharacterized protein n=1 Tax=Fusarium heterosporum TaxID=42747 RepID=A0A8H5WFG0_FUSHE|nr:hypothetical protein FHETE_10975 [Fusarium heterosporum]